MAWNELTNSISLSVFDQLRDESEVVLYLFSGGGSATIPSVVLSGGTRRDPQTGMNLTFELTIVVQSGAFTSTQPEVGDTLTYGGKNYLVGSFDTFGGDITIYAVRHMQESVGTAESQRLR